MSDWYVLDENRKPVQADLMEGARALEKNRHVARTSVGWWAEVSTVFLSLDHAWDGGPPLVFETMIFGGSQDEYQERYSTWEQAEAGHLRAIRRARLAWFYRFTNWLEWGRLPNRVRQIATRAQSEEE